MISATLILNWNEDGMIYRERQRLSMSENSSPPPQRLNPIIRGFRLAFVILFIVVDIVQIARLQTKSFAAQGFGALTGLLIGVFILQNRKVDDWELIFQWIAFAIFGLITCVGILWHIIGSFTTEPWFMQEK